MLTGVEITGIVLALIPLCITALEHHEQELRALKAIYDFRRQYQQSVEDLSVCHMELKQTIENVFRVARIADEHELDIMAGSCDSLFWQDPGREMKLIAHFGESAYKQGFKILLQRVSDDILKVSKILDLGDIHSSTTDKEIWNKLQAASQNCQKLEPPAGSRHPVSTPGRKALKVLVKRGRYIFRGAGIGEILKRLGQNINRLEAAARRTAKHGSAVVNEVHTEKHGRAAFVAPLYEIQEQAHRLQEALQRVLVCPVHKNHSIILRLDQRLKSGNIRPGRAATDKFEHTSEEISFSLAFSSGVTACQWHSLGVHHLEGDELHGSSQNPIRQVSIQLGSATHPPSSPAVDNLCALMHTRSDATTHTRFYLNANGEILERDNIELQATLRLCSKQRISMRSLLDDRPRHSRKRSLMTQYESIILALTVSSTFLQFFSTSWLSDSWCSGDVFFLEADTNPDLENPYVSRVYGLDVQGSDQTLPRASAGNCRLLKLGILLLEVSSQQALDAFRRPEHENSDQFMWDLMVAKDYVDTMWGSILPCFQKAIEFCLKCFVARELDLSQDAVIQQVIDEVLTPFHHDLLAWRSR